MFFTEVFENLNKFQDPDKNKFFLQVQTKIFLKNMEIRFSSLISLESRQLRRTKKTKKIHEEQCEIKRTKEKCRTKRTLLYLL